MIPTGERRLIVAIILTALAVRIGLLFAFEAHQIEAGWEFGYETGQIARALAAGDGFSSPFREPSGPTAWLMPAYPALLALLFKLFGTYSTASALAILLFNSLCSALLSWAVFLLAREPLGRTTALVSAAVMAVYPPALWHAINTVWDTTLLALLMVLLAWGVYLLRAEPRLSRLTAFGLALGAALWVNPVVLVVLPLAWLQIWRKRQRSTTWRLVAAAFVALLTVAVVSPWLVRNHRQFDQPYLRSNLGLELRLGNSEAAWQDYQSGLHTSPWALGHPSVEEEELRRFVDMGEPAYLRETLDEATAFIRDNPSKFARLALRRFYFFWLSDLGTDNEWRGNLDLELSVSWMRKACHLLPLPFLALGVGVALRRRREIGPLLGVLALFPLIYYVTHVSERYRFPIEPFIVILGSYGAVWLVLKLRDRWRPRPSDGTERGRSRTATQRAAP